MNDNTQLITKYRPDDFDIVIGNEAAVKGLAEAVASQSRPHAYLFTGTTGVGKTTLARIIAKKVDATVEEICAATQSSVEDTRRIVAVAGYKPITGKDKLIIIDECHNLSDKGWQPLLKLTEDPPPYIYLALCTTEVQDVPSTIKSRCYPVSLKPVKPFDLQNLLRTVAELEGWQVEADIYQGIVQAAGGSVRQALVFLQVGHALKTKDELSLIISEVESENNPAVKLAQALLKGVTNWKAISKLMEPLKDEEAASISIITRYLAGCLARSEEEQAQHIYRLLRSFVETNTYDHRIHLYTAIGKCLWGQLPF